MSVIRFIRCKLNYFSYRVLNALTNLYQTKSQMIESTIKSLKENGDLGFKEIKYLMERFDLFVQVWKTPNDEELNFFNSKRELVSSKFLFLLVDKNTNAVYDYTNDYYNVCFVDWINRTHMEFRNDVSNLVCGCFYDSFYLDKYFD